jgi:hypothetical protein
MAYLNVGGDLVHISGGFSRPKFHFFSPKKTAVLFCESCWYEPHVVEVKVNRRGKMERLIRKKHERIDIFEARVKRLLKFLPRTYESWSRNILRPQLRIEK